jgi:hypothetical protein
MIRSDVLGSEMRRTMTGITRKVVSAIALTLSFVLAGVVLLTLRGDAEASSPSQDELPKRCEGLDITLYADEPGAEVTGTKGDDVILMVEGAVVHDSDGYDLICDRNGNAMSYSVPEEVFEEIDPATVPGNEDWTPSG